MFRRATLLGLVALVALGGPVLAGTTANITITVTVEFLSVSANPTTVALGTVAAGTTTIGSKVDITNDGNAAENIGLTITNQDSQGAWTSEQAAGANQYVLYGIIVTDGGAAPIVANCQTDDVLYTSVRYWQTTDGTAANSACGILIGTATPVPAGGARDLYFGFAAPTSVFGPSANLQHSITVELSVYKD